MKKQNVVCIKQATVCKKRAIVCKKRAKVCKKQSTVCEKRAKACKKGTVAHFLQALSIFFDIKVPLKVSYSLKKKDPR